MMALMASFWMGADDCLCERKGEAKRSVEAEPLLDGDGFCDCFSVAGRRASDGELTGDEALEAMVDVLLNELTMVTGAVDDVDDAGAVACSGGRWEAGEATDDDGQGEVKEKVEDGDGVVGVVEKELFSGDLSDCDGEEA